MASGCFFIRAIGGYSIGGYWWLLVAIILVTIGGYSIKVAILLMAFGAYYINGYWCLLY